MTTPAPHTILIVDDDREFSSATSAFLKGHGYQVLIAYDATLAMKYARKEMIGLVLLDVGLPAGGGLFVLHNLRKLQPQASLPVIISTANVIDGIREHVMEMGANDFLPKPYDLEVLLERVKAFLPSDSRHAPAQ